MKKILFVSVCLLLATLLLVACTGSPQAGSTATAEAEVATADNTTAGEETVATDDTAAATEETTASADASFTVGFTNWDDTDLFCKYARDRLVALSEEVDSPITVQALDAQAAIETQLSQIETFISQGMDAIVMIAIDKDACVPAIEAANEAGTPIICLITPVNTDIPYTYVGSTNLEAGQLQGDWAAEVLPENAKILYMTGVPGLEATTSRWEGFEENCLKVRTDVELLSSQNGEYDTTKAMTVMEDWLQAYPEFDAVICANDAMALGVAEALKGANKTDVIVVGVDGAKDACTSIANGEMTASLFQNWYEQANQTYATLVSILVDGEEAPEKIIVPFELVDASNVQEYIDKYYS